MENGSWFNLLEVIIKLRSVSSLTDLTLLEFFSIPAHQTVLATLGGVSCNVETGLYARGKKRASGFAELQ